FFSSRRRHTSFSRDWSSDVCSSDLVEAAGLGDLVLEFLDAFVVELLDAAALDADQVIVVPVAEDVLVHDLAGDRLERVDEAALRSEEHTSELQSRETIVCRLLLEKR